MPRQGMHASAPLGFKCTSLGFNAPVNINGNNPTALYEFRTPCLRTPTRHVRVVLNNVFNAIPNTRHIF